MLFSTPFVAELIKAASLSPANPRSAKSGSAKPYAPTSRAMPRFARFTPRASALLATTSIAALLLGAAPVEAGGLSFAPGQTITYANVFTGSSSINNGIANVLVFGFFSNAVTASLTPGNTKPAQPHAHEQFSGMALTPGVASGVGTFTTLTNPLGAILPGGERDERCEC